MSPLTVILQNGILEAEIDVAAGAAITRLESKTQSPGFNVLDRRGLQCWIKTGTRRDALSGVLRTMYEQEWVTAPFTIAEQSASSITVAELNETLSFTKCISLVGDTLQVEVQLSNHSAAISPHLQIEHIGQFAGGRIPGRDQTALLILENDGKIVEQKYLESFGQRYGEAHTPSEKQLALGFTSEGLQVNIKGSSNSECLVGFCRANIIARGVTSTRFDLQPGETYRHVQLIQLKSLHSDISPPVQPSKAPLVPKDFLTGEPVFKERWSHICLQYDLVNPDDIKRIVGKLLAPWGYTGVIFEIDRGVQTLSHPELSPGWAMSRDTMLDLIAFTREHGLEVGLEFNVPGHQMETGFTEAYPQLMEPPPAGSRAPTLCLRNEQARTIVEEVITELLDTYKPDLWLIGGDEIQIDGEPGSMGHCPLCKGTPSHELLIEYFRWLCNLRGSRKIRTALFGDMFIRSEQFGPNVSGNANEGETWRALDTLSPDVEIMDWHYYPAPTYKSLAFFEEHQRIVWPVTAFHYEGTRAFLCDAEARGIPRAVHSTWGVPNREKLPIESMVWAGLYHWLGKAADELDVRRIAVEWCREFWRDQPDA